MSISNYIRRTLVIIGSLYALLAISLSPTLVYAEQPSGDITSSVQPGTSICDENVNGVSDSSVCQGSQQGTDKTKNPLFGPNSLLGKIVQAIVFLVGALSVIMIIIGGLRYILSGGDSAGLKSAKDTILYAIIGLVIAIFAQALVSFVVTRNIL